MLRNDDFYRAVVQDWQDRYAYNAQSEATAEPANSDAQPDAELQWLPQSLSFLRRVVSLAAPWRASRGHRVGSGQPGGGPDGNTTPETNSRVYPPRQERTVY